MTEQVNTPVQQEELEWPIERVRQTFIDYFVQQKGHTFVPSSAIVIPQDETLLFTNAGMNQFKPIFLGQVDPNSELASLKRAANSQKCIRAGGKHNDLKDVGRDSYHHTMFEMLGSWSFGDYFKVDCIKWAWELLTEVFKMDKSRLYATYFGGDEGLGLAPDEEAKNEWLKYLPEERILASGLKDNFWEMGATGPCGPCSEIHYDKVGNGYGRSRVNEDDPLVIEIWNLVFIQYVREEEGGALKPLPAKHCDTGMGLERLTSILQHKQTNYDIDIFQKLFANIQRVTKARAYTGKYYEDDKDGVDMAYRIVADHIRTITLAISDGVLPSNIGRGYVLRRIIRRAVRYGLEILGDERGFFSALAPVVVELMSGAFPTLLKDVDNVVKIIRDEEMQFSRTLHMGLKRLNRIIQGKEKGYVIPGEESAKLNHTYGFPFDLTRRIAKEKGYNVDKKAHEAAMLKNAGKESNELQKMEVLPLHGEAIVTLTDDGIVLSDDTHKYNPVSLKGRLVAIWLGRKKGFSDKIDRSHLDDTAVDSDNPKNHIGLIFDKTPFYAEQGGQIHDIGEIKFTPANGGELVSFNVESVQVYGGYVVHYGTASGEFKVDDEMDLIVNLERRKPITSNHTSTHLVNHSLRNTLGNHIEQQGSQVLDTRFRFDFAHTKPLSAEELLKVDEAVSQSIEGDHKVYYKDVPLAKAREILGVRQMFGEKYPDPVRVVSIGVSVDDLLNDPTSEKWLANAIEFCGGTHSISTKEIEAFATVSEDAVAKGVRRIVCVTGNDARQAIENADNFQKKMEQTLEGKTHNDLSNAASTLLKELDAEKAFPYGRKLRFRELLSDAKKLSVQQVKELEKEYKKTAATFTADAIKRIQEDKVSFLVEYLNIGVNCTLLKSTIKDVQKKFPTTPICLISFEAGKFAAVASTDKEHQDKLPANKWISETMVAINGKGGGKADNAQGVGAGEESQAQALVDAAKNFATSALQ